MKVKISNISNEWKPVKIGLEEGFNMVVVTQAIEPAKYSGVVIKPGKTLKLNLNSEQKNKHFWLDVLKEGNILDVTLRQTGKVLAVDKYHNPTIIKRADNGKEAQDV